MRLYLHTVCKDVDPATFLLIGWVEKVGYEGGLIGWVEKDGL